VLKKIDSLFRTVLVLSSLLALHGCATFENHKGEKFPITIKVERIDKPAPSVIVSHGGSCRLIQEDIWAKRFQDWGYNTVIIDHCSARNIGPHTGIQPPPLRPETRVDDYIAVAEWIRHQKWHNGKIAVFGISRGGEAVMRASDARFVRNVRGGAEGLAQLDVYVALYPACSLVPKAPRAPILVMHGELDNLAVFGTCEYHTLSHENYIIKTYPGAHHGFDMPGPDITGSNQYLGHFISGRYNAAAAQKSINDTKEFLYKHLKQ
jgi:dienelactone hydrolase